MKKYIIIICFFFSVTLTAQTTSIPDQNFEQALIDLEIDTDQTINGLILTSDINSIENLMLAGRYIGDLAGIEAFSALKSLNISQTLLDPDNGILDLSALTNLEEIIMDGHGDAPAMYINYLVLSNNPNLKNIQVIDLWAFHTLILKGSDNTLNNLEIDFGYDGANICIEVTSPNDAQSHQGAYSSWTVIGNHNFSEDCNLSVSNATPLEATLYPNPTQNTFQIQTSERAESVKVFSMTGKEVTKFNRQKSYDISHFPAGVYFVRIKAASGESVQELIKK